MSYQKNFDAWHTLKKKLDAKDLNSIPYFSEREVWFCTVGTNIGFEQDGGKMGFRRPVLIIKRCNAQLFIGIPLTTKKKKFPFYFDLGKISSRKSFAMLSQMRAFSTKRLIRKIDTLTDARFNGTKKAASEYIFGS